MKKPTNLYRYIEKAKPFLSKQRFSKLKIDDLVKSMDISKATFYKYFSSKDEIIELFIDGCVNYLKQTDQIIANKETTFPKRFQKTYEQSLKSVIYISNQLLEDLKVSYPELFEKISVAQQDRNSNLQLFFASGVKEGFFRSINPTLFMVQDDTVLREIMHPSFSIQYDMTLKQALFDFYLLKKYQLFKPEHLDSINDIPVEKMITNILQSIR